MLIYHKVLINSNTEQDTEQDKHTNILVEKFTSNETSVCLYVCLCSND